MELKKQLGSFCRRYLKNTSKTSDLGEMKFESDV